MLSLVQVNRFLSIVLGGLVLLCATVSRAEETSVELESIQVPEGCLVEQVAASPLVKYPMLGTLDDTGRLFVCESAGLNLDAEQLLEKLPNSVRMLEDTDGDGRMDRSEGFADQVSWPTSVCCYRGGIFVLAPQYLYYFKDTDGDNRADVREVVLSGFGRDNVQSVTNGLQWGIDNRIYFAAGRNPKELLHRKQPLFLRFDSA